MDVPGRAGTAGGTSRDRPGRRRASL